MVSRTDSSAALDTSLKNGEPQHTRALYDQQEKWISIERGSIVVNCNLSGRDRSFPVPEGAHVILSSKSVAPVKRRNRDAAS